ncbi:MAG: hypothetical protein KIS94_05440 [Chitinophagales bacterium]|nr:hypothetical protein [Chitinophagales bacterium]
MKKLLATTLLIVFALALQQCRNKQQEQLTGIWQLDNMEINGTTLNGSSLGKWLWEFNDKGGYLVMVAGAKEKGKYSLKEGKLTMKSVDVKEKPETAYNVLLLDSAHLHLSAISDKNSSILYFIKIEGGETEEDD